MNRVIKFRAWHIEKRIMADVGNLFWDGSVHVTYKVGESKSGHFFGGNNVGDDWNKSDCFVMQFTGLLDKNGKEIYEGDIISTTDRRLKIEWADFEGYLCFCAARLDGFPIDHEYDAYPIGAYKNNNQNHKIEVIGNIHENPELI